MDFQYANSNGPTFIFQNISSTKKIHQEIYKSLFYAESLKSKQ